MQHTTTLTQRMTHVLRSHSASSAFIALLVIIFMTVSVRTSLAQEEPVPLPELPGFSTNNDGAANSDAASSDAASSDPSTTVASPDQVVQTIGDSRGCYEASKTSKLSWFYKPPSNYSVDKLGKKFDIFVLTKDDEDEMDTIRAQGGYPILQYIHWDSIHDPCKQALLPKGTPCSCNKSTWSNQPAWFAGDICDIRDEHPEWFLRGEDGELLYWGDELIMDPGSEGWRNFFMERVATSLPDGWDGIFIDNLASRFGLHNGIPTALEKYPDDKSYQDAVVGFLRTVNNELLTPRNKLFYSNFSVVYGDTNVYHRYMEHMDGSQDEFWGWKRNEPYSALSWEERFVRSYEGLQRGKVVMMVSQGARDDWDRQYFTYASYLLLASDKTFYRYSKDTDYDEVWMYKNYKWKLGEPLADYKKKDDGVFIRKFQNGKVKVWPGQARAKIKVKNESGMVCQ